MNISNELILGKANSKRSIYSITPFTLLDYPDKTACIIWFAGCNMRCLYCYNPSIVLGKGVLDFQSVIEFLKIRIGLLDGVVLSGGECTLHKNIIPFARTLKAMGFVLKIDTNGSNPEVLQQMIEQGLLDYVALDFKALAAKFNYITQSDLFVEFEKSLRLLMASTIEFEIRTTLHSDLIDEGDFLKMIAYLEMLNFEGTYYIQYFMNDVPTLVKLDHSYKKLHYTNFSTSKIQVVFRN